METYIEINTELPKIGRALLERLWIKKLTMPEFDKECAYWMVSFLEEHHKHPEPSAPEEIINYRRRKALDLEYKLSNEFWNSPNIADYIKQCRHVFAMNKSNFDWLCYIKQHIPKEDIINHSKIQNILNEYKSYG